MNATVTLKNHHFPTPWSLLFPSSFALASQACLLTSFQQSDDLCEQMASSSEILHMPCYIKPRLTRSYSQHDIIDFLSREIFGVFQAVMLAGTSKLISQISLDVNLFTQSISQHLISQKHRSEKKKNKTCLFVNSKSVFPSIHSAVGFLLSLLSERFFLPHLSSPPQPSSFPGSLLPLSPLTPADNTSWCDFQSPLLPYLHPTQPLHRGFHSFHQHCTVKNFTEVRRDIWRSSSPTLQRATFLLFKLQYLRNNHKTRQDLCSHTDEICSYLHTSQTNS